MLRVATTLARVLLGFVLASLTAGLVTVLFVNTPADVVAQPINELPASAGDTLDLALLTATHAAIFAAAFVLISAGFGEWFSIRSLPFYLIMGCSIALLGLAAQFSSEVAGQPTILNNYAIKAFLTAGFFSGFMYWLASGQFAGAAASAGAPTDEASGVPEPKATPKIEVAEDDDEDREDRVVIRRPAMLNLTRAREGSAKLMNRLKEVGSSLGSLRAKSIADVQDGDAAEKIEARELEKSRPVEKKLPADAKDKSDIDREA